ncbi:MAG: pilus assembly protein [Steroidobacteraceae bacterium]|jgi:type IV pilus assembly protein PilX
MRPQRSLKTRSQQRGVVLFVALILLLILSLLGVTAARMQTTEERMARNEDNRQIGAQAAEAALRAAEYGLTNGLYAASQFANNANGFYELNPTSGSVLQQAPPSVWNTPGATITYPDPANPMPALTSLPAAAQSPKYIIENLPAVAMPGDSINQVQYATPVSPVTVYRVTANATGADSSSTTILQSIFR